MGITKDSTLGEIMVLKGADKVLAMHNVPCVTCPFARMEMDELKLGDICENYGLDCDALLEELNGLVKKGGKK
ncbi:MAG: hypothetical protein ACP5E4_01495 [Candidatus Aenigmatarchaeota archaeon]